MRKYYHKIVLVLLTLLIMTGCSIYGEDRLGELVSDSSLIAYYPFNGNASDDTGNGHNGYMYSVTPTYDRFNVNNRAFDFDGATSYVEIPAANGFNLSGSPFTISVWINSPGGSAIANYIFYMGNMTKPDYIELFIMSGNVYFLLNGSYSTVSGGVNTPSMWYHIAAVFNGESSKMYINGMLKVEYSLGPVNPPTSGNINAVIGSYCDPATYSFTNGFIGTIDDVAIFNRALSSEEISRLYNNSK